MQRSMRCNKGPKQMRGSYENHCQVAKTREQENNTMQCQRHQGRRSSAPDQPKTLLRSLSNFRLRLTCVLGPISEAPISKEPKLATERRYSLNRGKKRNLRRYHVRSVFCARGKRYNQPNIKVCLIRKSKKTLKS